MLKLEFRTLDYAQFDRRAVRSAMGKAARIVAKELKASVGKRSGGGIVYLRSGRRYKASAAGQPPVRVSGALWRSVKGRPSRRGYAMVVSADAPHAHLLELGTKRARARPAFRPAFELKLAEITGLLRGAIGDGLTVTAGTPGKPPAKVEKN